MFSPKEIRYLLIIVTLLFTYCCSEPTESIPFPSKLIPLKIGNNWNSIRTVYDSEGNVEYTDSIISTIDKDTTIEGSTWYGYSNIPPGIWYTNKSDGYWVYAKFFNGGSLIDTFLLVYKYPAKVGDVYDGLTYRREVVALDELIFVPAGTFRTIHFVDTYIDSSNYLQDSFDTFVAKRVGIVKRIQKGRKSDGSKYVVLDEELENYTLK